ncbi:MAG: hypothetical protein WBA13_15405 [Microcoleaceae cyanobacterium]
MEKISNTNFSKNQIYWVIIIAILDIIGLIEISLGSVRWFHFPYLLFLDEWHFLWATVALTCGLCLSQIILDQISYSNLSRIMLSDSETQSDFELKQFLIKIILGILGIIILEFIMRLCGLSSALRGLGNLGIGISCLWSSRVYWIALFQND